MTELVDSLRFLAQNDDNQKYNIDAVTYEEGYEDYVQTTVDPGYWLLLGTCLFCFVAMFLGVPCLVAYTSRRRSQKVALLEEEEQAHPQQAPVPVTIRSILAWDDETRKILKLAIPYSISGLTSSTLSNTCLIFVSQFIGTKAVAAYALVQILVGLSDSFQQGPIFACTSLCAQAVGARNPKLAGEYIQIAMFLYLVSYIPVAIFWWFFMYEVVLFLEWGDDQTAMLAQEYVRVYIWSTILSGLANSLWQLLEVADRSVQGTIVTILWGVTNVVVIGAMAIGRHGTTLAEIGYVYIATALLFIGVTLIWSVGRGWLKPFYGGLFGPLAVLRNPRAVALLLKQGVPLAFGSLLSNAEWAILTFFASHLGPAEVAAWAILGSIWDVFYSVTYGIGDAAEIRIAYHLGDYHPTKAKLSAFKSLVLGMGVASVVSLIFFSLHHRLPAWFTSDPTLQAMLEELVPFVGVANLTMTFGMQCWSAIGAQGRYKLATWVSFFSSWGLSLPLAAIYVYVFNIDLQGLTSAVVMGYVTTSATLAYVLLLTDWNAVAKKVQDQNAAADMDDDTEEEGLYASLKPERNAHKATARRNIRILTVPAGQKPGIVLGSIFLKKGIYVTRVRHWSPLKGSLKRGDAVVSVNGVDASDVKPPELAKDFEDDISKDRELVVKSKVDGEDDETDEFAEGTVLGYGDVIGKAEQDAQRKTWGEVVDPHSKKVYYYNRLTRNTTWTSPFATAPRDGRFAYETHEEDDIEETGGFWSSLFGRGTKATEADSPESAKAVDQEGDTLEMGTAKAVSNASTDYQIHQDEHSVKTDVRSGRWSSPFRKKPTEDHGSMNQSYDRSMNQSYDRSMDRSIDRSMDRSMDLDNNAAAGYRSGRWSSPFRKKPTEDQNQSYDRSMDRSIDRSMDRSMDLDYNTAADYQSYEDENSVNSGYSGRWSIPFGGKKQKPTTKGRKSTELDNTTMEYRAHEEEDHQSDSPEQRLMIPFRGKKPTSATEVAKAIDNTTADYEAHEEADHQTESPKRWSSPFAKRKLASGDQVAQDASNTTADYQEHKNEDKQTESPKRWSSPFGRKKLFAVDVESKDVDQEMADRLKNDSAREGTRHEETARQTDSLGEQSNRFGRKKPITVDLGSENLDQEDDALAKDPVKGAPENDAKSPTSVTASSWISAVDPASKRLYYYNKVTRKTTWVNPVNEAGEDDVVESDLQTVATDASSSWVPRLLGRR